MDKTKVCGHCKKRKKLSEFSTNPCHKDGINNWCKTCVSDYNKKWRIEHTKKYKEYKRKYWEKNKEVLKKKRQEYKRKNKIAIKIGKIQHRLKISKNEATRLYNLTINGVCAICGKPESLSRQSISIDHNHNTGKIRGLLCSKCNTAIGYFGENIKYLQNAIKYLQKHGE